MNKNEYNIIISTLCIRPTNVSGF